jgi:hypothetical protein
MSARDEDAAVRAQFTNFRLSADKTEVIYEGRTADHQVLEVRQPVADLDVMLVLVAHVLQAANVAQLGDSTHHAVEAARVEPNARCGLVLKLDSHGVTRSFHLPSPIAGQLGADLVDGLRRNRMRLVT